MKKNVAIISFIAVLSCSFEVFADDLAAATYCRNLAAAYSSLICSYTISERTIYATQVAYNLDQQETAMIISAATNDMKAGSYCTGRKANTDSAFYDKCMSFMRPANSRY